MNPQEQFWRGEFGDEYTRRNRVDWWARVPFWSRIIAETRPRSVIELGCNAGWNLMAIRALGWPIKMAGVEINSKAVAQAGDAGLWVIRGQLSDLTWTADLVFTAGVLIHVAPENLGEMMGQIVHRANRYVLAVEYDNDTELEIEYRGNTERLWKRPYGKLYADLGLREIESGDAPGFDRCTYWLMEKRAPLIYGGAAAGGMR